MKVLLSILVATLISIAGCSDDSTPSPDVMSDGPAAQEASVDASDAGADVAVLPDTSAKDVAPEMALDLSAE